MLCLCGLTYSVNAQIEITIGDGDTNSGVLPIEDGFKYSVTQQIFTADELLATEGNFTAVSFKMANASNVTRSVKVYMANTEKDSFTHTQDWVNLPETNLVYSGPITYPGAALKGEGAVHVESVVIPAASSSNKTPIMFSTSTLDPATSTAPVVVLRYAGVPCTE